MKTAVCLQVQNEEAEIVYWISWYKSLGFDSFIIYNDHSSDATEEVILSLRGIVDIRYFRNAPNNDFHVMRQVRAYNDAVERYGREFNWIAFFDADEYLDLEGKSIKEFLQDKNDVSQVAFNWCCAGTNNHLSRPEGPPFLNYPYHGKKELFWQRHTKCIVRPDRLTRSIYQVHSFPVQGETVDSSGTPIHWSTPGGGLTANQPSWEGGRLYHYQSRSFEHYIRRDRNLEDLRRNPDDPLQHITHNNEYNEEQTELSATHIEKFYEWMAKITTGQTENISQHLRSKNESFLSQLKDTLQPKDVAVFQPTYTPQPHELDAQWVDALTVPGNVLQDCFQNGEKVISFYVLDHTGKYLGVENNKVQATSSPDSALIAVYCRGSDYFHLFSPNKTRLEIQADPRILPVLTYKIWNNQNDTLSFSHPRTGRYLCALPNGTYTANRKRALGYECYQTQLLEMSKVPEHIRKASEWLSRMDSLESLRENCLRGERSDTLLLNALTALGDTSKKIVQTLAEGVRGEYLF